MDMYIGVHTFSNNPNQKWSLAMSNLFFITDPPLALRNTI